VATRQVIYVVMAARQCGGREHTVAGRETIDARTVAARIGADGLRMARNTRIELGLSREQRAPMTARAILRGRLPKTAQGAQLWRRRAEQARRLAGMLSPRDAALLEDFAVECEAQAEQPRLPAEPQIAA
jgi:hypothetical protein